jgi:hypothetical protein
MTKDRYFARRLCVAAAKLVAALLAGAAGIRAQALS